MFQIAQSPFDPFSAELRIKLTHEQFNRLESAAREGKIPNFRLRDLDEGSFFYGEGDNYMLSVFEAGVCDFEHLDGREGTMAIIDVPARLIDSLDYTNCDFAEDIWIDFVRPAKMVLSLIG